MPPEFFFCNKNLVCNHLIWWLKTGSDFIAYSLKVPLGNTTVQGGCSSDFIPSHVPTSSPNLHHLLHITCFRAEALGTHANIPLHSVHIRSYHSAVKDCSDANLYSELFQLLLLIPFPIKLWVCVSVCAHLHVCSHLFTCLWAPQR